MKTMNYKNNFSIKTMFTFLMAIAISGISTFGQSEKTHTYGELEALEDKGMDFTEKIYSIVKDYPAFSYEYVMEDGKLKEVEVTGIDNKVDKKRVEVAILDLKANRNAIKNEQNRMGVFYSPDKQAKFKKGEEELSRYISANMEYPDNAENFGAEGMVYVKFVVDENGEIPFATADTDVENSLKPYTQDLKNEAIEVISETSGKWEPAKVEGVEVASLAVMPVHFDFRKNPSLPALIR